MAIRGPRLQIFWTFVRIYSLNTINLDRKHEYGQGSSNHDRGCGRPCRAHRCLNLELRFSPILSTNRMVSQPSVNNFCDSHVNAECLSCWSGQVLKRSVSPKDAVESSNW